MDFFADLEIADEESETRLSREERINRAFEDSKKSYKNETVIIETGWFNSDLSVADRLNSSSRAPREVEWAVQQLYLQRKYASCLQMSLDFLNALDDICESTAPDSAEPKQELRRRELLDIGMRCALKLKDARAAQALADRSRPSWRTNAGLASAASDAYILASRPYDAITASLDAIAFRGPLHAFLSPLSRAFGLLEETAGQSESETRIAMRDAAGAFRSLIDAMTQRASASASLVLSAPQATSQHNDYIPAISRPAEQNVRQWSQALSIRDEDASRLVKLCCQHEEPADEKEREAPRSVRTL